MDEGLDPVLGIYILPRAPDVVSRLLSPYRSRFLPDLRSRALDHCGGPPRHHCLKRPHDVKDSTVFTSFSLPVAASSRTSPLSFPSSWLALRLSRSCLPISLPRWRLALAQYAVCGTLFLRLPSSLWHPCISAGFSFRCVGTVENN